MGEHVQLKASYEHAYRLPTSNEMFGSADGLEVGQANLRPEKSDNFNLGVRYTFKERFFVGGNFSYVDMRNMSRYKAGSQSESTVYKDRMPNQPYLYGNAEAGVSLRDVFRKGTLLDVHYVMNYIHAFDYDWESYNGDIVVLQQISHDLFMSYNFGKKREFTFSAECRNLLDERLYDNFRMQKPGRSFAVKIGYNFSR